MRNAIALGTLALLGLCAGCGSSVPTERLAEQVLRDSITEAHANVNLVSVRKIDGQKADVFGVPLYTMKYEAEVEFTRDGGSWMGAHGKKGERAKVNGSLDFHKTEKGWQQGKP